MAWPVVGELIKAVDVSYWQRGWQSNPPFDVSEFVDRNPEVEFVYPRAASSWRAIDIDFAHYYDGFQDQGLRVAPYVNMNPYYSVAQMIETWKAAFRDRKPKMALLDCETSAGKSGEECMAWIYACLNEVRNWLPETKWNIYTADWWWSPRVTDEYIAKFADEQFVVAHYPNFVQEPDGDWRQAEHWSEVDDLLPIDNNFTPLLPKGVTPRKCKGWQFSERGKLHPVHDAGGQPRIDLNYFKRNYILKVFGEADEEPEPTPTPVVRVTAEHGPEVAVELEEVVV